MASEVKFDRDTNRFDCHGLDLNRPVDSVKPKKFPVLQNMRSYQDGRLEPRLGLTDLGVPIASQTPVHSCRRLNDTATGAPGTVLFQRVIGAGTRLAYGTISPFTPIDSGYSGEPLAMVPYRPEASPSAYMYIADRSRMRKLSATGDLDHIGYARPREVPGVALDIPYYKEISNLDSTAGWASGGDAAGGPALTTTPRATTTIAAILYDSGPTGWACCQPTTPSAANNNFGPGEVIIVDSGGTPEPVTIQEVHSGSTSTNIASVSYDSGATGLCSVVLTTPLQQVAIDALILNSTLAEYARIVGVVRGPDDNVSIRVSTASTWVAGNVVEVKASFRAYFTLNHIAGQTLENSALRKSLVYSTGIATFTLTGALDLSYIDATAGVATHPEDYMHIAFRVDRPDLITEIRVQLDVDATTNDFTRNFYMRVFRASDITQAIRGTQTLLAGRTSTIQRTIIDATIQSSDEGDNQTSTRGFTEEQTRQLDQITTPSDADSVVSQQFETGDTQWFDMRCRISELIRVGTDDTRTLQNVQSIRIAVYYTNSILLDMDSWWIGGGLSPDTGNVTARPYLYRYRVRNPTTNVASNWSPETRLEVMPWRQQVIVTPTQYTAITGTTLTATDLVLDIQRFGGEIAVWHYVGTTPNAASPRFLDKYGDDTVADNPSELQDRYQLWPIVSVPVSGTTAKVSGTTVDDSVTSFSMSWAPGTTIKIDGIAYTLYRVISTSKLELVENAGAQGAVSWRIDEPLLMSQNLPCLWGDDAIGVMFGCGDAINPGRLYYSNGNDPDSTRDSYYIDITSPSEPLMNGVIYNLRSYVFSSERMFQILPDGQGGWTAQEVPNGKGLFSRWAITRNPAPFIAVLGKDGIYATTGGAAQSLTDEDLYPFFPNEGNLGQEINLILPPNIVTANQTAMRLEYYDEFLYFDYVDTDDNLRTLVKAMDTEGGGWYHDTYTPGVVFHYGEEGPNVHSLVVGGADVGTGRLYQYTGDSDNGAVIVCGIRTPAKDQGDARANKLYGDIMLDADTQGVAVSCTPYVNNYATAVAPTVVTTASRLQTAIPVGATSWTTARNLGLELIFTVSTSSRPLFYIWEARWTFEAAAISAFSWQISPTTFGMENFKHMGMVHLTHVSAADVSLTVTLDGVAQTPIIVSASGSAYRTTAFRVPVYKARLWEIRLSSAAEFRLDGRDTFFEIKEWASEGPYQQMRVFSDYSLIEG